MVSSPQRPVFLALTTQALVLKEKIDAYWQQSNICQSHYPDISWHMSAKRQKPDCQLPGFTDFAKHCQELYLMGHPIIGICATAILIRALAPVLQEKNQGPPVLALSEDGSFCIPLLGGHHGGNHLADLISEACQGQAVVTTAGDCRYRMMLDNPPAGWRVVAKDSLSQAMGQILAADQLGLIGETCPDWLGQSQLPICETPQDKISADMPQIAIGVAASLQKQASLQYVPQKLVLGIGCARDISGARLWQDISAFLTQQDLLPQSIVAVTSLDLKKDEAAIHYVAQKLGCPARFFSAKDLADQADRIENPSKIVEEEVGCPSVAEASALALAGPDACLRQDKIKISDADQGYFATLALAESPTNLIPPFAGQSQGGLYLVSMGPGGGEWRTPAASQMLHQADIWVGYQLYLDLLSDHAAGKTCLGYQLGQEKQRVREALSQAGQGQKVALIGSGDVGIYAMGALVYELLDLEGAENPDWQRITIETTPGVSALQMAAARAGAPLGHDFCAISLSDLLTPRQVIYQRLRAAAEGDFVIAFYNPVSKTRRTLLAEAKEMLLAHRPPETPVWLARNLGREGETHLCLDLAELEVDQVDMLTTVVIGNSQSQKIRIAGGSERIYTPRGYREKQEDDHATG